MIPTNPTNPPSQQIDHTHTHQFYYLPLIKAACHKTAYLHWISQHSRAIGIVHWCLRLQFATHCLQHQAKRTHCFTKPAVSHKSCIDVLAPYMAISIGLCLLMASLHMCTPLQLPCSLLSSRLDWWPICMTEHILPGGQARVCHIWQPHTWCYVPHLVHVVSKVFSDVFITLLPYMVNEGSQQGCTWFNKRQKFSLYM